MILIKKAYILYAFFVLAPLKLEESDAKRRYSLGCGDSTKLFFYFNVSCMKKTIVLLTILICTGCTTHKNEVPKTNSTRSPQGLFYKGPVDIDLEIDSFQRESAEIYLPNKYKKQDKWPLVILLHGIGSNGKQQSTYLSLQQRVSRRGYILVTPNGIKTPPNTVGENGTDFSGKQFWNATDYCCDFAKTGVNDVLYIEKLIKYTETNYKVDSQRIYLFGHSNGGFMANRLACEMGDKIAAIANLAGGNFKDLKNCEKPIHYLHVHGVNDDVVKYEFDNQTPAPLYASGVDTVNQWKLKNRCSKASVIGAPQNYVALMPKEDTTKEVWENCDSGKDMEFWKIKSHSGKHHNPHAPLFHLNFTNDVLDFLLSKKLN